MRTFSLPAAAMRLNLFLLLIIYSLLFGCKKIDTRQLINPVQAEQVKDSNNISSRSASQIRDWLDEKKTEIGIDSNATIDKVLYSMDDANAYTETFKDEQFIIIPIEDTGSLSRNIRTDLNAPLKFLLMVEDESGNLRKGNIALFYPSAAWTISLPQNFFKDFFENQTVSIDGTFALLSLDDIKQYEMDFENGNPKEFRLWQGKLQPAQPTGPVCYDHYLVTTVYYSDGTCEIFEEYLYTQCIGNGGGGGSGGGGTPPNTNNPVTRTVQRAFVVARKSTSFENWTMSACYQLTGISYPGSPSLNTFTTTPVNVVGGGVGSLTGMIYGSGFMHSVPAHIWYIQFSTSSTSSGLRMSNRYAWANFTGAISYPNQSPAIHLYNMPWNWPAAVALQ